MQNFLRFKQRDTNKHMIELFRNIIRKFRKSLFEYEPLVRIKIQERALLHNFEIFSKLNKDIKIAPVLKSNAYGHGLTLIGRVLDDQEAPFFVVDSYYEALILKNEKTKTPLLVIGYTFPQNIITNNKKDIVFTLSTINQIKEIAKLLERPQKFHIKIDTGMNRQGIKPEQLSEVITLLSLNKNIYLDGVCSHLADADGLDSKQTDNQRTVWNEMVKILKDAFSKISYFHIGATAGTFYEGFNNANVARVGLGLYGIDSSNQRTVNLSPALSMESVVVGLKSIKKGDRAGYNGTFEAIKDMNIAIVPVGYFEGVDRRLSNVGMFTIRGCECPIVGRVSMNMTIIDVSSIPDLKEGETVCVISNNTNEKNSVSYIAKQCATIPYDILVRIPERLRREIIH